jgi:phosphoglycolate phosphatase
MNRARAFIFDLDGTLVDSLQDISAALNAALAHLKQPPASGQQVRSWVGDGLPTLCARAAPGADPPTLQRLVQTAKQHYRLHCTDHTRLYPKVLQMLNLLKVRQMPIALLSNKPHQLTVQVVRQLGLGHYFREVRGCLDEQQRKPSPSLVLQIARRLGIKPHAVIVVGDSVVDIRTARNAGMIAVAVTWGFRSRAELAAAKPDFLVDDPLEIPRLPTKSAEST